MFRARAEMETTPSLIAATVTYGEIIMKRHLKVKACEHEILLTRSQQTRVQRFPDSRSTSAIDLQHRRLKEEIQLHRVVIASNARMLTRDADDVIGIVHAQAMAAETDNHPTGQLDRVDPIVQARVTTDSLPSLVAASVTYGELIMKRHEKVEDCEKELKMTRSQQTRIKRYPDSRSTSALDLQHRRLAQEILLHRIVIIENARKLAQAGEDIKARQRQAMTDAREDAANTQ